MSDTKLGDLFECKMMDRSGDWIILMVTKITDCDFNPITLTCMASHAKWWHVGETTTRCHHTIKTLGKKIGEKK